jgi:hypothetical protein
VKPRHLKKLYYFTIEDESVIPEAFGKFEPDAYAVAYKVVGTDDVFVTTQDTRAVMDRHDLAYNLLAEEDSNNIAVWHTELSREELAEYEEALRALALAFRAIAIACVGINGDRDLAAPLAAEPNRYTYFGAPGGHTFVLRLFSTRDEAVAWATDRGEVLTAWATTLPLSSADELRTYH